VRGDAAAGSGADYDHIVCFGSCLDLRHADYFTPVAHLWGSGMRCCGRAGQGGFSPERSYAMMSHKM
jgi:hypothetical protein